MLDQDGDGQITYEELMATIKEATEASELEGEGGREGEGGLQEGDAILYYINLPPVVSTCLPDFSLPLRDGSQGREEHPSQ